MDLQTTNAFKSLDFIIKMCDLLRKFIFYFMAKHIFRTMGTKITEFRSDKQPGRKVIMSAPAQNAIARLAGHVFSTR